ncbi:MAG TPA: S1 RNA-binding domain-containing protein [Pelolinea sp.]|nr:S1 RNA-binding domain-containing protein [Pelolinea sp.]
MNSEVVTGITSSDQLESKMHLKGKIIKTSKAGAIVDIGVEKPALLHVSQIVTEKNEPILKVEDALKENQEVEVFIRNLRGDRIEVTMRKPLALEWREINKDMILKGKIVELEKFGAFVDIGAERPGLVHISELTQGYVRNASDIVNVGDEVDVKVIDFNRRRKQIRLSMKALQPGLDEIEGVKITPARPQRRKSKERKKAAPEIQETKPIENDPTVMEIRMKEAMEKADLEEKNESQRDKKQKLLTEEQEKLLSRTLNQR